VQCHDIDCPYLARHCLLRVDAIFENSQKLLQQMHLRNLGTFFVHHHFGVKSPLFVINRS